VYFLNWNIFDPFYLIINQIKNILYYIHFNINLLSSIFILISILLLIFTMFIIIIASLIAYFISTSNHNLSLYLVIILSMIINTYITIISILSIYVLFSISVISSHSAIITPSIIIQMKLSLISYYTGGSLLLSIDPSYIFNEHNYSISYLIY
jgi:hypothetical protein